jgi:TRAP-type C4-dicarboxylate transport system substrate-binding protein
LSKDEQASLMKFAREAQQEQRKLWAEMERKSLDHMKQQGVEIITFSDQQKKTFQDAVKPVWDKYGAKYSSVVKRIQDVK